ncbi:MAG: HAD hydrolase family protein [Candidatus Omnitrophica bacterium]|nr:HAD hydrolase family protein [Candidatus Omnitrophota bacterium]
MNLKEKFKKIRLLLLDVDGVLTDGRIIYDSHGRDLKFCDVNDGMGVYLLKKAGILTILITAKGSRTIKPRALDMRVEAVLQDVPSKAAVLEGLMKKYKLNKSNVCFVGDDLVDLGLMKRVGLAVAVANACPEIKKVSHYITKRYGGRGAVREVAELILKSQNKWRIVLKPYL